MWKRGICLDLKHRNLYKDFELKLHCRKVIFVIVSILFFYHSNMQRRIYLFLVSIVGNRDDLVMTTRNHSAILSIMWQIPFLLLTSTLLDSLSCFCLFVCVFELFNPIKTATTMSTTKHTPKTIYYNCSNLEHTHTHTHTYKFAPP